MWSHGLGHEAASDLPELPLAESRSCDPFRKSCQHLAENLAKARKSGSHVSSHHDPAPCPDPLGKDRSQPDPCCLLKSRARAGTKDPVAILCLVYTRAVMATRGPQEPGETGDPGGVVTGAVTTPAYKKGSGGGSFFLPAPLPSRLPLARRATAAALLPPERRVAGPAPKPRRAPHWEIFSAIAPSDSPVSSFPISAIDARHGCAHSVPLE